MYDPKFEKGVRQKMEGLEFSPSESVWANIQKAVAGQRRRRGGFYFWRLAIPAALLAGVVSVGYFATRPAKTSPPVTQSIASTTAKAPAVTPANPTAVATNPTAAPTNSSVAPDHLAAAPDHSSGTATQPSAAPNEKAINAPTVANDHSTAAPTKPSASPDHSPTSRHYARGKQHTPGDAADAFAGASESLSDAGKTDAVNTRAANASASTSTATSAKARPTIAPYLFQPGLASQRDAAAIKAARPSKKNLIALGSLQKTKRPWEAGFSAGGGISKLNRLNISAVSQDQALSASLYNIATSAAAPSKSYVSDIRPDASFTAGIYLQKPLSSRWSVNLGMNLHYYSTRITIGERVNTYVPAAASLITPNVSAMSQNATSFVAGDRQVFRNHYYFLELPVNVQYKLNKSNLLPLFVEGGVSLSRLMGSDALFYNAHSGVYYKDPGVLQKTQFNVSSALMVGLPFHGVRIQAGPQVQYGLTPLINNHSQGDQHFLYAGIRVVVIPVRK